MEIRNLCKTYGEKKVLSSFCADFQPGKRYALMGPSGIGKTTLARLILGLEKPDGGVINGVPARVSAVFQENRLIPELTIPGNLRFILSRRFPEEKIRDMLEALSLTDCLETPAFQLSGGQQRRAALARALLVDADLLVLDEPFTGLDAENKARAIREIDRRVSGTLLLVTHSREDAEALGAETVTL